MRAVDEVEGEPAVVIAQLAAAPFHGGDGPARRVAFLGGWVEAGECTRAEVEAAHLLAHHEFECGGQHELFNWGQAVVVLSRVLR